VYSVRAQVAKKSELPPDMHFNARIHIETFEQCSILPALPAQ
jgi:hypothetical protein